MEQGTFVISLDFELLWGMQDKRTIDGYGKNLLGVREAIPLMLEAFDHHRVKATFATVGLLFFDTKESMSAALPVIRPQYSNSSLSPYSGHLDQVGSSEDADPYHFAGSLIRLIQKYPAHEIACHTFSHYYCLERGQTEAEFSADLDAAIKAANQFGVELRSFVFPRNQYRENYLKICWDKGITSFRGNERNWLYDARNGEDESTFRRGFRLLDTWFNLSGHNCHDMTTERPLNIPSSRFLRPWSKRLQTLDGLRLRRITRAMDHAAHTGKVFHLWWHPHNFGSDLEKNMAFLNRVLVHYGKLRASHNMRSMTMSEVSDEHFRIHAG
jgi:peptidoglycan/xylan/chitin deacetylase (PgdA/CDA1 family)